jgi:hypothetical protein
MLPTDHSLTDPANGVGAWGSFKGNYSLCPAAAEMPPRASSELVNPVL